MLTLEQLNGSFPSEVTFEPADSLQLHATMQAVVAGLSQVSHLQLHGTMCGEGAGSRWWQLSARWAMQAAWGSGVGVSMAA